MTGKSILETVHETAQGLHNTGAMDTTTMREFDLLCLPPVKRYTPLQIKTASPGKDRGRKVSP